MSLAPMVQFMHQSGIIVKHLAPGSLLAAHISRHLGLYTSLHEPATLIPALLD